jgi:DNA transformation protein
MSGSNRLLVNEMRWRKPVTIQRLPASEMAHDGADSFGEFVSDQLRTAPDLRSRVMFGGQGLYQRDRYFGIIHAGRLFFKTTPKTAKKYIHNGMKPFEPKPGQILRNYYEVPIDVIEDDSELAEWAREAVRAG